MKNYSSEFMNNSFLALPVGGATFRRVGWGFSKKLFINAINSTDENTKTMAATATKIFSPQDLATQIKLWRQQNLQVVFTNGCFDILHLGHIDYLEKARQLGDKLVVGLNTDASVRQLKGESRPINNEYARSRMLAALEFVDAVTFFGTTTPLELIQLLLPNILVKGSDYTVENIVGADVVIANGGQVKTIDLVAGYSTTGLVQKMKGI